jgi:metal-responsive CopG/Arc/MetJ family transcriptional regulator
MGTKKTVLNFAADEKLMKRINNFRFGNRIETRSEALRILIEKGLKKYEGETEK